MSYITDDEMAALPQGAGEAFVAAERIIRKRLEQDLREGEGEQSWDAGPYWLRYHNEVLAIATHVGVADFGYEAEARPGKYSWDDHNNFITAVDSCTMRLRLERVRPTQRSSVSLDTETKEKLRSLLQHMRELVDPLDLPAARKDAIFSRINDLQEEIDKQRTTWQAVGGLFVTLCESVSDGASKLEPAVRVLERIGAAFGYAKSKEDAQAKLPAPPVPKRIESSQANAQKKPKSFDNRIDEIPF